MELVPDAEMLRAPDMELQSAFDPPDLYHEHQFCCRRLCCGIMYFLLKTIAPLTGVAERVQFIHKISEAADSPRLL